MQTINRTTRNLVAGLVLLIALLTFTFTAAAQETPDLSDPEIGHIVVVANQIDVDYGKIALEKSDDAEIQKFAQTMIDDHTNLIEATTDLAKELNVTPEDNDVSKGLLKGEKDMTQKLENAEKGKAFDKAYIDNEVAYHEAVISTVKDGLIPQAENEKLKQTLKDVTPLLEHHLEMAKETQESFN